MHFLSMILLAVSTLTISAPNPLPVPDYLDLVRQAEDLSGAEDWDRAAQVWQRVVIANPFVAGYWYSLGIARYNAGQYREAIEPLTQALELGMSGVHLRPEFDIARAHGRLGEATPTLDWLERALAAGFRSRTRIRNDEAFRFLAENARFRKMAGLVDLAGMSRTEGLRYDLAFMDGELRRMHSDPFRKVSEETFEANLKKLFHDLPDLTDNQYAVRLMRLLADVGDGHTGCFPEGVLRWTDTLPLHFEVFPEGVYIIEADATHAGLVGRRVLRVGQHTMNDVLAKILPIASRDNDRESLRLGRHLRYPQILEGLGLIAQPDRVELIVQDDAGKEESVTVKAARNDPAYNRTVGHPTWRALHRQSDFRLPLYLKDRTAAFWFEHVPKERLVYCQYNLIGDTPGESLAAFTERLFQFLDTHGVATLVIDLRWNNGGNAGLLPPLFAGTIRSRVNRPGHLFVVVGRYTFSAAMSAAVFLEQQTNAILVGEPTASSPNRSGESNIVILPYGQIGLSISDLYWQDSWPTDRRTWIAPQLLAPPTFEMYRAGRDPALEAVHAYPRRN